MFAKNNEDEKILVPGLNYVILECAQVYHLSPEAFNAIFTPKGDKIVKFASNEDDHIENSNYIASISFEGKSEFGKSKKDSNKDSNKDSKDTSLELVFVYAGENPKTVQIKNCVDTDNDTLMNWDISKCCRNELEAIKISHKIGDELAQCIFQVEMGSDDLSITPVRCSHHTMAFRLGGIDFMIINASFNRNRGLDDKVSELKEIYGGDKKRMC